MRRAVRSSWLLLVFALACSAPSEAPPQDGNAPVILISIDTLRSDYLGTYGNAEAETPNIDRLANESTLFERAYATCPLTLPSHASIFTGSLPPQHGVRDNRGFALDSSLPTLAEHFQSAGYRTGGFVSSMVLRESTGIARGFEMWDATMDTDVAQRFAQRRGDQTLERALAWLNQEDSRPPFLFLHLYDPHSPYDAPAPYGERIEDPYAAEVAWTDALIGQLLDALDEGGWSETSWVVLLSDHGEGLGDHGELEHGIFVYRESIQVPLMIRPPSGSNGRRVDTPVSLADLMPSLLDRLFGETSERSWFNDTPPNDGVYAESMFPKFQYGFAPLRTAIRGELQYIDAPRAELYDLVDDPDSRRNLLNQRSAPPSLLDLISRVGSGRENRQEVGDDEAAALASLGYVGGAEVGDDANLPDPKDRIDEVEELFAQVDAVGKSSDGQAERRVAELMRQLDLKNESLATTIAENLMNQGAVEAAEQVLAPFASSSGIPVRQLSAQIAMERGEIDRADRLFATILTVDSQAAPAQLGRGLVALHREQYSVARERLQRAVEIDASLSEAWNGLAVTYAVESDWPQAIGAWRRAVELDPELADGWYNLAIALERSGDAAGAREARARYAALTN